MPDTYLDMQEKVRASMEVAQAEDCQWQRVWLNADLKMDMEKEAAETANIKCKW